CRSSIAARMWGQPNFMTIHATAKNARPWTTIVMVGSMLAPIRFRRRCSRLRQSTCIRQSAAAQLADERIGENQQQGDGDADDGNRVQQAGDDEHLRLQHAGQLRWRAEPSRNLPPSNAKPIAVP